MGFATFPKIESVSLNLLPSFDNHPFQVLIDHDSASSLNTFPLMEVLGHLLVNHISEDVAAL